MDKAMNTEEILQLACATAGLREVPADSGVLVPGDNIKKVLVGIDMEAAEILIAKQLGFDAVITHHPKGGAPMLNLYQVMDNQIERMVEAGVPINKAQKALADRKDEVDRASHVGNYDRALSAAKLLEMPFIAIHSPADLLAQKKVQNHLDQQLENNGTAKLKDVLQALELIPEYQHTLAKPKIRVGSEESYAGKVFVTMAGGTGGGDKVVKAYFEAGVGTLVVMHMPDQAIKEVRKQNIGNVVVAGHMASDSVGINAIIKALEAKGLSIGRASGVVEIDK
ncbi:MAG: Nif3-like dinuclear metal center hexameric protein [Bacillota bacterium]|nr:Nif3-like dinuclear metal center hexameric protein [Bacillota bacterium]